MEKASTRHRKSDHIFACILHSENHLSRKYNTLEAIWQYLYFITIIAAWQRQFAV